MPDAVTEIPITLEENDEKIAEKEEGANKEGQTTETKEPTQAQPKQRSVSFNRDVHVKRFGTPREARGASSDSKQPVVRKEPFTHLSEQELIDEAAKVIAQAESVSCTADHPPEKFFSLPYRKKLKQDPEKSSGRRNSDDLGSTTNPLDKKPKTPLGRSTSDVTPKKKSRERTSLSTLFRKAHRNTSPETHSTVIVTTKPGVIVKRSKSDVSDLKSNTNLNTLPKPIRKRSGSESEEFLNSLRNKKTQLSPIIEISPREDYFKNISPLDKLQQIKDTAKTINASNERNFQPTTSKVNPVEKPPRIKTPENQNGEPKPPTRAKRSTVTGASNKTKEESSKLQGSDVKKNKAAARKALIVDEVNNFKTKDNNSATIKERIKDSIHKIQNNIYGEKEMIHSSQQPPDKLPLTKGHTVDHIVKILKEDQLSPPPKAHLITPPNKGSNNNQPFSYTRPSASPDPNLYIRPTSPERPLTPVNKMNRDKGIVYAQVVCNQGDNGSIGVTKQTVHKTYSPARGRHGYPSDEDEGLGYEDQRNTNKFSTNLKYNYDKKDDNAYKKVENFRTMDSPITPRFKEYKLTTFEEFEPTYANESPVKEELSRDFVDSAFRGRADGMDSKRRASVEPEAIKAERYEFNDLSHRRQLLESRMNARRVNERQPAEKPIKTYLVENDPIFEAENRMKATEKYVNETARYYRHTLERDGYVENSISDNYNKFDSDTNQKINYNNVSRTVERKKFPPEPEYEPPSLESNIPKPVPGRDEYVEKKYKSKSRQFTSSHDTLHTGQKYSKTKDERFGKRKGHYASNPEIAQEREEEYVNAKYDPKYADSYHNSLKRDKNRDNYDRYYEDRKYSRDDRVISRHGSSEVRDNLYPDDRSPRGRYDNDRDRDNRFVDSGIENDFRKDSSGEIHRTNKTKTYNSKFGSGPGESDEEHCTSSMLIASERRHTEENNPQEQIYANGEYHDRYNEYRYDDRNEFPKKPNFTPRERSIEDGSHYDPRLNRLDQSPTRQIEKVSAKPPKAVKKLSGLEKMKQLFSRDSSKKSKKEKEAVVQSKTRTRVLKSPEHLAPREDLDYRQHKVQDSKDDLHRRYKEYRGSSDDRDSDHRSPKPSDGESELKSSRETSRKSRSRTEEPMDSPRLAEHYSQRRRLATPSPTPSPPRRSEPVIVPKTSAGNWFKSLDRLSRKRGKPSKGEKESYLTTEDESTVTRKTWNTKTKQPLNSPAKNLRFFGDTDLDSDANVSKHTVITKSKSHPQNSKNHGTLRKTISNSSHGLDEIDRSELSNKSYSLSNLHREEEPPRNNTSSNYNDKYNYKSRNLHNISEIHSNSETESQFEESHSKSRKAALKPPMSPYDRRSRSHSSSKNVKSSTAKGNRGGDLRKSGYNSSRSELRNGEESRGSSSELRGSKQELSGSRGDLKLRRRAPGAAHSGESSTEGDSSHQSQRSVVYLHATTVGDIPDPGRVSRGRSKDDVSSVNSSQLQVKTVARSFSLLGPWRPRHHNEQYDVHYAQTARPNKRSHKQASPKTESTLFGKSKSSSTKNLTGKYEERPSKYDDRPGTLQKNRSSSQTTLSRRAKQTPSRLSSSSNTLYRRPEKGRSGYSSSKENINTTNLKTSVARSRGDTKERDKKSMSTEVLSREAGSKRSERDKVSRSISIPKDENKKAGWFKLTNKNKKTEHTSRVR